MSAEDAIARLPGYVGVWRLLVPLSGLGGPPPRPEEDSPSHYP
jgi:hypothetical protein